MDWSRLHDAIPFEKNFRWRGGQVSRLEAFSDAVFALSVTLLVVSTDVPASYADFIDVMKALPAFALSFVLLALVWFFHFLHFRRYGLEDGTTTVLNLVLLFTVLVYVYPLKFMWVFLTAWISSGMDAASDQLGLGPQQVGVLLVIYGAGIVVLYSVLALMTAHALRLRDQLELDEVEVVLTRGTIESHCIQVAVGALSAGLAFFLPAPYQGLGGPVYFLLPIAHPIHGVLLSRREKAALAAMEAGDEPVSPVPQ